MQSTAWRYFGRTKPILIACRSWCTQDFWQNEANVIGKGAKHQRRFGLSPLIKNDLAIIGKGPDQNQLDGSAEFCDATKCRGDCFR